MKTPLILVSGLLSNASLWKHQATHLREIASVQIISPSQNTAEKMVQAILEKAPPTFALAGHSMGGWLCLEIMRIAPFRVSKLCLLNTTAQRDTSEKKARRQKMILRTKKGHFKDLVKEIAGNFVFNSFCKNEVEEMFLEVGEEAFIHQEEAMINRKECQSILPNIMCPTLVIHASEDKNFSLSDHEELASKIPYAKLAVIDDSGHMSPIEMPQAVTTLLRFWLTWF